MRIAVLGPGGVGGLLAGALHHAGAAEVVLIAREATAARIARQGLHVESRALEASFTAHVPVATTLREDVDVLLVATKAAGLGEALDRVQADPGAVVPLLNGLEHMAVLRARFGDDRVVAGAIRVEAHRPLPGHVVQSSPSVRVDVAGGGPPGLLAALRAAGVRAQDGGSEADTLWRKLCRLNALAATTAAYDLPLGPIREHHGDVLEAVVRETCAVAQADGADVGAEETLDEIAGLAPTQTTSLARDVAAGNPTELDAICGAVLRRAAMHGLPAPTVRTLAARIAARTG